MTNEQIKAEAEGRYPKALEKDSKIDVYYDQNYSKRQAWIAARTLSMQEREKEIADAFESGELYGRDQQNVLQPDGQIYPDKQQYINQITGKK